MSQVPRPKHVASLKIQEAFRLAASYFGFGSLAGRNSLDRFIFCIAEFFEIAIEAFWFARKANSASMPDQLV